MLKTPVLPILALAGTFAGLANAQPEPMPAAPRQADEAVENCASVTAMAVLQTYGVTHVVVLRNNCDQSVVCEVWTNVDPEPHLILRADPGQTREIVTQRGSTSTQVVAGSSCHFE